MHWIALSGKGADDDIPEKRFWAEHGSANQYFLGRFATEISARVPTIQRQTANLHLTRDLLLPRLLSGQVNLTTN
jgi:hypothetical protein